MGMSSEMSPRYLTVNPSGQVTYILETTNISLAQVQLATAPTSEVFLIQEGKQLPESPILVADMGTDNISLLGNNVIVLVSQPQEVMIVNSDITTDAVLSDWQENSTRAVETATLLPVSHLMTNIVTASSEDEEWSSIIGEEDPLASSTAEDARMWLQDSLITTAALTSLSSYVQSRASTKDT